MPRAGRPVIRRVSAVWRAAAHQGAARWIAARRRFRAAQVRRADLDHRRAEPSAASTPARSAMPPAAITGRRRRATICGTARTCRCAGSGRRRGSGRDGRPPRAPARSPRRRRAARARAPRRRSSRWRGCARRWHERDRAAARRAGRKWKLTTCGRSSSTSSSARRIEREARRAPAERPRCRGRTRGSTARGRSATPPRAPGRATGGRWQKKLRLKRRDGRGRADGGDSRRIAAASSIAHGSEPRPPALQTAIASALSCAPAIGAWITGSSTPRDLMQFHHRSSFS